MQLVWDMDCSHAEKLFLLKLADNANDEGEVVYNADSFKFLRRVGSTPRYVKKIRAKYKELGILETVEIGGGRGNKAIDKLNLDKLAEVIQTVNSGHGLEERVSCETSNGELSSVNGVLEDQKNGSIKGINHKNPDPSSSTSSPLIVSVEEEVLVNLNYAAGRKFRPTKENLKFIHARLADYTREDVELVAMYAAAVWPRDDFMCKYIQPSTIFGGKFGNYLERAEEWDRRGRPANFEHSPGKTNGKPKETMAEAVRRKMAKYEQPTLEAK